MPDKMNFEFQHSGDQERCTVSLSKAEIAEAMSDELFEKVTEHFCHCESVGETNVVDCNCSDYTDDFVLVDTEQADEAVAEVWADEHGVRVMLLTAGYKLKPGTKLYFPAPPPVSAAPALYVDLDDLNNDNFVGIGGKRKPDPVHNYPLFRRAQPELSVWYGSMPESNGKTNWTALLHRKGVGLMDGITITIDRSEYPDRVRYEADRMRFMIGELAEEPDMMAYDADLHSGYVAPERNKP